MRRLFLIILLALLPLQASWAAMCGYCPDECITEVAIATPTEEAAAEVGVVDAATDCERCQVGGVGIAAAAAPPLSRPPPIVALIAGALPLPLIDPERPERPNWLRAR